MEEANVADTMCVPMWVEVNVTMSRLGMSLESSAFVARAHVSICSEQLDRNPMWNFALRIMKTSQQKHVTTSSSVIQSTRSFICMDGRNNIFLQVVHRRDGFNH